MITRQAVLVVAASVAPFAGTAIVRGEPDPTMTPAFISERLASGELAQCEAALEAALRRAPDDQRARFGLGVAQFLSAVEDLAQSLYRHGLRDHSSMIPLLRLPVEANRQPTPPSHEDLRNVLQRWLDQVGKAEATLAVVSGGDVKLHIPFGRIRLDLNGDGLAADAETFWRIYKQYSPRSNFTEAEAISFSITLDIADVHWLRGYCHLLMAMGKILMAYDWQDLFERTGHLFFDKIQSPYDFLREGRQVVPTGYCDIVDLIAFGHLLRLPLKHPRLMAEALQHFKSMIAQSRAMWKAALAENDDDKEWIPNPRQTGVIPGVRVTDEMIRGWHQFLDEFEAILDGKKLIPFWRGADGRGVNLRRVFTEPRELDAVLWLQGTAATPYLEKGELTSARIWRQLQDIFQGRFLDFAIWFN